ncbi:MAG: hypothetical protein ACOX3E_04545 [Desulfomonilia bacterium]|uniref:Triphosphoribosyl-dephospho-CoA synthase n=1 Tax=anaerobic digester metagenome TaxID=1263854 RepID=A0A485M0G7_9ZZZZ|nr:hypothetical protein [Pseudomonadota bacterium]HPD21028.1 hypothetical protein [Deltaproteobacteria bacterium]HRS55319.1 hypothetical protein [Desulfomonilia bacterium]HRV35568.1 hypothetical protein [Desulfomonilia bacterium]
MSTQKTYRDRVMNLSSRILGPCDSQPVRSLTEALTIILAAICENVMAGTGHIPDPEHSTIEKCSVSVCFMAACTVPLISQLREGGQDVDAESLLHRAGQRIFERYGKEDQRTIVESGMFLFKELINEAPGNHKLQEWMGSVHNVTDKYVRTGGRTDCVDLFAPLYLVLLMATKQTGARPGMEKET